MMNSKSLVRLLLLGCFFSNLSAFAGPSYAIDAPDDVIFPKEARERSVRGNIPLSPGEQPTTVDKENVFSRTWHGLRTYLAGRGIQIDPVYKGEFSSPISGGIGSKTVYLGNLDLKMSVNAEKLIGWTGGTVFVYGLFDHGAQPSVRNIGDAQGTSNIEVVRKSAKLYEVWAQQSFLDGKVSLLVGLHDLNSEFYVTESASLFLNPSFGIGKDLAQTGVNGPSIFPVTSLAARARFEPAPSFYLQSALFDARAGAGNPSDPRGTHASLSGDDGSLAISEMGFLPNHGVEGAAEGKYAIGTWSYSKTFEHQTEVDSGGAAMRDVSHGFYLLAEQNFFEKLALFTRFGKASSGVNRFSANLAGGFVFTGLLPGRSEDRFGFAVTQARNGQEYRDKQEAAGTPALLAETTFEVTYRIEFKRGRALQLDYQSIRHPNTDPLITNAKVGMARFEIAF